MVCCGTGRVKAHESRGCDEAACFQFVAFASSGNKCYFEAMSLVGKIFKKKGAGYPVHNISGFVMKGVKDVWHNL